MRTTLDIDDAVLSAARAKATAERISIGKAISELALQGLRVRQAPVTGQDRFPVMTGSPDHLVTDEMVAQYRDDDTPAADAA